MRIAYVVATIVLVACSTESATTPSGHLSIAVAPLDLRDVVDVCYRLDVANEARAPVWSASDLCASRYGNGAGGDLAYVGTCDATDPNGDQVAWNTVTLHITEVRGKDANGATTALHDWRNPCDAPFGDGCTLKARCVENADTAVTFDLTVMRRAEQGFFDVAVDFEDIFCSAKVDCAYPNGKPIELVMDPQTGKRVPSIVWALTCTDGDPRGTAPQSTHLYMNDVVLRCGTDETRIHPYDGPGNLFALGAAPPARPLVQAMVFEGSEALTNGAVDADGMYWSVALGLNASFFAGRSAGDKCTLETSATASHGLLTDGWTPTDTDYPVIHVSVPVSDGKTIVCTQHGLDATGTHEGVSTGYTGPLDDGSGFARAHFSAVESRTATGVSTDPTSGIVLVDECAATPGPCDAHATCTDLTVGFECECDPGWVGDGVSCADVDECTAGDLDCGLHGACVNEPGGATCACDFGYELAGAPPRCARSAGEPVAFGDASLPPIEPVEGVVAVAAGWEDTVALRGDGTVVAWGYDSDGETEVPTGLTGVSAVAAGWLHTVALKDDGTVVAWGRNNAGQTSVPDGLGNVVAVAAGRSHTVALRGDGTVVVWGDNAYGQTDMPAHVHHVVAVAAGANHTVALRDDGTVVAWGADLNGETDVPTNLAGVVAVVAGGYHNVALKDDGTVVAWGYNSDGQTDVPAGLTGVIAIAAGGYHTVVLKENGTVAA